MAEVTTQEEGIMEVDIAAIVDAAIAVIVVSL